MATDSRQPLRLVRDTAAAVLNYTGPSGEPVFNQTSRRVHVQDGQTQGGIPLEVAIPNVIDRGADATGSTDAVAAFNETIGMGKTWRIGAGTFRLNSDVINPSDRLLIIDLGAAFVGLGKIINQGEIRDFRSTYGQNYRVIKGPSVTGYEADAQVGGDRLAGVLYGMQIAGGDGISGLLGVTINTLPGADSNGNDQHKQPSGVTAYGELTGAGNSVFGLFARVDIRARGTGANELNTFNWNAAPPNSPNIDNVNIPNTPATIPITLTLAAAGDYPSYAAMRIAREGGHKPQTYNYGIVTQGGSITLWNAYFDGSNGAAASNGIFSTTTGTGENLVLVTAGPMVPKNGVISVRTSNGINQASVRQDGTVTAGASATTNALAQVTVSGSATLRGIGNTAAWIGVDATPGSGIGAGVQIGAINGTLAYVAASRYGAGDATAAPLSLITDAAERVRIQPNGRVGVGTTDPQTALDVAGPIRAGAYTAATLPAGAVGAVVYVANARKVGEGAGSGTGVIAYFSNGNWRRLSDDSPVAA